MDHLESGNQRFHPYAGSSRDQQPENECRSGTFERDFDINPFSYALNTSRAMRAYDDDGNYEYYMMNYTPFSILNELDNNRLKINMMDTKFQAELEVRPLKGLEIKALGAVRYVKTTREHRIHEQSNAAEAYRSASNAYIRKYNKFLYDDPERPGYPKEVVMPKGGFYNRKENDLLNYYQRAMVNYNTSFNGGLHTLNVMAGKRCVIPTASPLSSMVSVTSGIVVEFLSLITGSSNNRLKTG